jgi:hypothetical protein
MEPSTAGAPTSGDATSPARDSVFVSHGGANHPLALALRSRLRDAGFSPYVYDPRRFRLPAHVERFEVDAPMWADLENAGAIVNISHLRPDIDAASYVLVLDDARRVADIDSWHIQGEVVYAAWLARVGPGGPAVVAMPPRLARALVLEGSPESLRGGLVRLGQRVRPLVTFVRAGYAVIAALGLALVSCGAVRSWRYTLVAAAVLLVGIGLLFLTMQFTRAFTMFTRAAYLGEVNDFSPLVTLLFGHRTRQMQGGDIVDALMDEVRQDILIARLGSFRRFALRGILTLPWIWLFGVLPAFILLALICLAFNVR